MNGITSKYEKFTQATYEILKETARNLVCRRKASKFVDQYNVWYPARRQLFISRILQVAARDKMLQKE